MTEIKSLAESFPLEQDRLRDLLVAYKGIGAAGVFGFSMISRVLENANAAAMSGDVVAMLRAYEAMKECQ